ncbi:Mur ligase family protein [Tengunoibacter tsumagoiensis]|nr:MurT ligase domain-containing protein [Tengunoibacter tsumagoiensis]
MRKSKPSQSISPEAQEPASEHQMEPTSPPPPQKKQAQAKRRRRSPLRAGLAVMAGRTAGAVSRRLRFGGGTSIVGVVAQSVYPQIVEHLASELEHGSLVISGTNGKTTTSSFIAAILRDGGLRVWNNREGSNLAGGVASSLVIRAKPNGHLRRSGRAISILEVDEAALPQVVSSVQPRVAVFTNLFRDQLDRYGEVDSVLTLWQRAIHRLPATTTLILNADDPAVAQLGRNFAGRVLYYGINDLALDTLHQESSIERHQVMDARTCPHCGGEFIYQARFYSHMGHYHCPNCGLERPQPDIAASSVQVDSFDRMRLQIQTPLYTQELVVPLPGLYNIYNALAAATAALALDMDWEPIVSGIEQSKPVFGRGERVQANGKTMRLLLAKNPTGFNEVLRTLFTDEVPRHVLFILNDNTADGKDISWIWDVDFERARGRTESLVVAGTRALDLALRLKYAGIAQDEIQIIPPQPLRAEKNELAARNRANRRNKKIPSEATEAGIRSYGIKNAIDQALDQTPLGETLFIVPTYTGLLEVHRELEQRGLTPHYWEGGNA